MYNFSLPLKNIIINYAQNSNYYNFNDVSFIGVYNTLKFIYSNFNDNISTYDPEIIQEMIDIIIRYRAKSLLNISLHHIKLTHENALSFFEIANKYNLTEFKKKTYDYMSENLHNGIFMKEKNLNESYDFKKILFENYFCSHQITIQLNTIGIEVKNLNGMTMSQDKFAEFKNLSNNIECLVLKKIIK